MSAGEGRAPRAGEAAITVEAAFPAAPLERNARVLTGLVALGVVAAGVALALRFPSGYVAVIGAPSLFVALVMLPIAFAPTGYAVGAGTLAVTRRVARPLLFPLGSLLAARATPMPRSRRLAASGGLFGWWGTFANSGWGRFRAYATDRRAGVLLEWPGFKLYVSPADPEALVAAVLERSGKPRGKAAKRKKGR
jgi:hypothetical protein